MVDLSDLSICIPYGYVDDRRQEIYEWILARYMTFGAEVISMGTWDVETGLFDRSSARNDCASASTKPFLYFADADTLTYPNQIEQALRLVREQAGYHWVTTQNTYYLATNETTDYILSKDPSTDEDFRKMDMLDTLRNGISHAGGYLVTRDQFNYAGGFDERFKGWGYEDTAFYMTMETLFNYSTRIYGTYVIHLEHPATRWENPYLEYNKQLFAPYQDAQNNVTAMLRVVNSR